MSIRDFLQTVELEPEIRGRLGDDWLDAVEGGFRAVHEAVETALVECARLRPEFHRETMARHLMVPAKALEDVLAQRPAELGEAVRKFDAEIRRQVDGDPPSETEALRRELRQREIREAFGGMDPMERRGLLRAQLDNGNDEALRAIETSPAPLGIDGDLIKKYRADFDRAKLEANGTGSRLLQGLDLNQRALEKARSVQFVGQKKLEAVTSSAWQRLGKEDPQAKKPEPTKARSYDEWAADRAAQVQ